MVPDVGKGWAEIRLRYQSEKSSLEEKWRRKQMGPHERCHIRFCSLFCGQLAHGALYRVIAQWRKMNSTSVAKH